MALIFMDGFDHYTSNNHDGKYVSADHEGTVYAGSRSGANSRTTGPSTNWVSDADTYIVGFATANVNANGFPGFALTFKYDSTAHVTISGDINRAGISVVRQAGTEYARGVLFNGQMWWWIEAKVKISDTVGTVEVRINEQTVYTFTGDTKHNSASAFINNIQLEGAGSTTYYQDDLYICDTSGAVNNDFLGDCTVETFMPSGAGAVTNLTPSAGSNYQNVDEIPADEATTYNYATAANEDSYAMANLAVGTADATVKGVQITAVCGKFGASAHTAKNTIRGSAATKGSGSTYALPDGWIFRPHLFETDPDTATLWTVAGVNAMEAGWELVT